MSGFFFLIFFNFWCHVFWIETTSRDVQWYKNKITSNLSSLMKLKFKPMKIEESFQVICSFSANYKREDVCQTYQLCM